MLTVQILTFRLLKLFTYYVDGIFPPFVLPIALAFRLFPLTRKMGNTLIAICLGVIFVFPLSLVFMNDIWWSNDSAWTYKHDLENTAFTFDKLGTGSGFMDGVLQVVDFVCGNVVTRAILTLGEFFWGLVFALIAAISCLADYLGCVVIYFYMFVWVIWPIIVTFVQLAIGGTILTLFGIDAAMQVGPTFAPIAKILLPAVAEATGVSLVSFFIVVFITFTGIKSISAALGGDYILYGVSRFI